MSEEEETGRTVMVWRWQCSQSLGAEAAPGGASLELVDQEEAHGEKAKLKATQAAQPENISLEGLVKLETPSAPTQSWRLRGEHRLGGTL